MSEYGSVFVWGLMIALAAPAAGWGQATAGPTQQDEGIRKGAELFKSGADLSPLEQMIAQVCATANNAKVCLVALMRMGLSARLAGTKDATAFAVRTIETALPNLRQWLADKEELVFALNTLASFYVDQHDYKKAEPVQVEALALSRKIMGRENWTTVFTQQEMAIVYVDQQRFAEAEPLYVEVLAIRRKTLPPEHPDIAVALNNLASLYDVWGRYREAEPLFVEALSIRKKVFGANDPNTADSLSDLGSLYLRQGFYSKGKPLLVEALAIREKVLGAEHPKTAASINNLATEYFNEGLYEKAEPLYEQALAIREKVLGTDHPETAKSKSDLALLYQQQGFYQKAETLCKEALSIRQKVWGAEHSQTADALGRLASLYSDQGLYEKAKPLYMQALAIRKKVLGAEHPMTAVLLNNLAGLYRKQGRFEKAEPLILEALAIDRKSLGTDHPDTAGTMNNLAELYAEYGRFEKAEPLYLEVLAISKKAPWADAAAATYRQNLASLYMMMGKFEAAQSLYEEALTIAKNRFGADSAYASALSNQAALYARQGKYQDAERQNAEVLAIRRKALPPEHPLIAVSLNNLAEDYAHQGQYAKAEPLFEEALAINRKMVGPESLLTAKALLNLAGLYQLQGHYDEAELLMVEALAIDGKFIGANLLTLPEQGQRDFIREFAHERDRYLTLALRAGASDLYRRLGSETNRLFKGMRLSAQQELLTRLRREGGAEAERLIVSLRSLNQQITALQAHKEQAENVAGLRKQKEAVEDQLVHLAGYQAWKQPVSEAHISKALPAGGALVDLAYYQPNDLKSSNQSVWRYAAFVYLPEGVQAVDLGPAEGNSGIDSLLNQALGAEARVWNAGKLKPAADILKDKQAAKANLQVLYTKLMGPIRQKLGPQRFGQVRHWIISPDGELGNLPWEMLVDEQGRYLIETSLVSYAESPRTLVFRNPETAANPAVAFLDPQYDPKIKNPPPGRGLHLSGGGSKEPLYQGALAKRYQDANPGAKLLQWQDAHEAALMATKSPANLLVWTHGEVLENAADPLEKSRILMAGVVGEASPTKEYDGYVTPRKMMDVDLTGTQLAVIAGCNTGYGTKDAGEGLEGMRRALWAAGSGSQLLTMWRVADLYTVRWLELFYEELRKPGMTRVQAVANVERKFIAGNARGEGLGPEQSHPYFWAAFTLSGNWEKIR